MKKIRLCALAKLLKQVVPNNPDKAWIKEVNSKTVKESIEDGYTAFNRFFTIRVHFRDTRKRADLMQI